MVTLKQPVEALRMKKDLSRDRGDCAAGSEDENSTADGAA